MSGTLAAPGGSPAQPFARRAVGLVAGLVALAQFAASFGHEYYLDEAYMLALGRHPLHWGYADQPPLVPLIAGFVDTVAPGSLLALRIPAILATAATVLLAALIARELGGDRRAQVLTAVGQSGALWIGFAGHWLTPYTVEPLVWALPLFVLVRWLRTRRDRLLVWLGVLAGIGAETKLTVLMLFAALLVGVLAFGPRELLWRPLFWVGALLGGAIAAPTLVWQALHGWPQLRMGSVVAGESEVLSGGRGATAVALFALAGVAGTYLLVYGFWRMARGQRLRFLAAAFVLLYVFVVISDGRFYYLDGWYAVGIAAGAVGLQSRREAGGRLGFVAWPAGALTAVATVAVLFASWAASNPPGTPVSQRVAAGTARAYHELPAATRAHTAVFGSSYIVAAFLDAHARRYGLPLAHSTNRGYGYLPEPGRHYDTVLYTGPDPGSLRPYFGQVRKLRGSGVGTVWLCTGQRQPWARIWPRLMHLTV